MVRLRKCWCYKPPFYQCLRGFTYVQVQLSGSSPESKRMPENEYACCGGGFPLTVKTIGVIGTICVSGLPHMEDHKLIVDALEEYLGEMR